MKKLITLFVCAAILPMFLLLTAYTVDTQRSGSGNWANSGSPGDGEDCSACHSGGLTTNNSWITTDIPAVGYTPGETYSITVATDGAGSGKKGFSTAVENSANASTGTLTVTDAMNTAFFTDHISHTSAGALQHSWSFNWVAPAIGEGDVSFYTSFVKDGYGGGVVNAAVTINELVSGINELSHNIEMNLFPVPVKEQLNISIPVNGESMMKATIISLSGQEILKVSLENIGNSWTTVLNTSKLNPGVYFITANSNSNAITKRFVVL